jgi:uncharacterized protein
MTRRPAKPAATPATSSVIRPPMPLDELDRWLRTPRKRQPVADCLTMLDGFVTAIVAGPVTYEPFGWLCPLLGVTKDACLNGDTLEFAAIAAVAEHHNIISAVLSETQNAFMPLFGRSETGDVDVGPWCRGFYAAIQLNPKFWRKLLPARRQAHRRTFGSSRSWRTAPVQTVARSPVHRRLDRSPNWRASMPIATSRPPSWPCASSGAPPADTTSRLDPYSQQPGEPAKRIVTAH